MAVFEYDTMNLPGTAALDPVKTIKDIGVTLTKQDIVEAGGQTAALAEEVAALAEEDAEAEAKG